ncbi:MAG: diaminopimelate epimerase [Clostridia bacterium]|nr:diaminopimelate epimerase [Clostridia bacterium]
MEFIKMHGLGNDYVYIDAINQNINNRSELAKKVSDRHFGIGSDGMILICKSDIADFRMQMFNSDGTEAEMCGNGIRCVGKFVYDNGFTDKENIDIETLAGIKKLKLFVQNGKVEKVKVDMGEPILNPEKIPVISDKEPVMNLNLNILDRNIKFTCVSMGNPHAVAFIEEDVNEFDIEKYGKLVEINEVFPQRTNVEFINIINKNTIKMRVWERGAGETLACGTGACASAVASFLNNFTEKRVRVELLGGNIEIEWNEEDNHIYMTGPATTVYKGIYEEG